MAECEQPVSYVLAAWGMKRIDDMTREELIVALNQAQQQYQLVIRAQMKNSEVPFPAFNWTMEDADARLRQLHENPMVPMK
jgi:hypothetical protein